MRKGGGVCVEDGALKFETVQFNERSYITDKSLEIQISIDYHTLGELVLVKITLQIWPLTADTKLPSEWN